MMPSIDDEPDLDWGDLGLESDEPAAKKGDVEPVHTDEPPPGAGETDWAPIRQHLIDHRATKNRNPDGSKIVKKRAATTDLVVALSPARRATLDELDRARKKLAVTANALGWPVRVIVSEFHVNAVLYVSDSAEDAASERKAGDVRYEAYDAVQWVVQAAHEAGVGFQATFVTRGTKTQFVDAIVRDPVGLPVENWADYSPSQYMRDSMVERAAAELAAARDRRYNDGSQRIENSAYFDKAGDLNQWLNDWLEMLQPDAPRLSVPAPKKTKTEELEAANLALIENGEWNG